MDEQIIVELIPLMVELAKVIDKAVNASNSAELQSAWKEAQADFNAGMEATK